ncbi:unnamed protein product [Closterium sp. NIES-53]
MGDRAGQTCGRLHTQHRCFSRLDDAWRAEFGDDVELPRWGDLPKSRIAIFDLDFDAFQSAMYALSVSAEGDCYRCVQPHPGIAAAALCASESALPGTPPTEALHTFTLDSATSCCFFRDGTNLTPLFAPVPVRLADPSGGPDLARSSPILPSPRVPSGSLSACVDLHVSTNRPSPGLVHPSAWVESVHLATEPPQVAASAQVSASGAVATPCSCHFLSHQNLLWHHRLGHPSLSRLRGMHSRLLVFGLPRSLPPLPPSPAPPYLPCVEGWQRDAPHSSSFPPTTAPLQTLHMDVWGPAHVSGQDRERYFLLVVDDYTRYTTVPDVLIPWICAVRLPLRERFHQELPILRLHSDRGGEFSSDLLRDFCRVEGILQLFTLPASPQKNDLAHTALDGGGWRCVGVPGLGSPAFVCDSSADKLSAHVSPASSLAFSLTNMAGSFTTPPSTVSSPLWTSHLTSVSQVDPLPGAVPVEVAVDSGAARGVAYRGVASGCAEPARAELGGSEPEGAEPRGDESKGAESGGAAPRGTASSGGLAGASPRLSPQPEPLSPQQLREWFDQHTCLRSGAAGAGGSAAGGTGAGGVGATSLGGARAAGLRGSRTRGTGAAGTGDVGGAGARGAGAGEPGAGGTGTWHCSAATVVSSAS